MKTRLLLPVCILLLFASLAQAQLNFNGAGAAIDFGTVGFGINFFNLTPAGGTAPYVFDVTGATVTGWRIANRLIDGVPNNASASATAVFIGVANVPGIYSTTIRLTDAANVTVSKTVSFTVSDVDLYGPMPTNYGVGDTVSFPVYGIGGTPPYTMTLASGTFPPGLSLTQAGGVWTLNGTLTTARVATSFGIKVTDVNGKNLTRTFSPAVSPLRLLPASPVTISPRILPTATQNQSYSFQLLVAGCTGGPCTFSIVTGDALPAGLTMSSSGLISGTPTVVTFGQNFSVNVTDPALNTVQYRLVMFSIPATPVPLTVNNIGIRDFVAGQHITDEIFASGGVPPYVFSVDPSSSLPAGVVLHQGYNIDVTDDPASLVIRSKSLTPATNSFLLRVQDNVGNVATRTVNVKISSMGTYYLGPWVISSVNQVFGTPYTQPLVPVGGTPPYTVIPRIGFVQGLTVANNGMITGTPAEIGRFLPFGLDWADSAGNSYFNNGFISVDPSSGSTAALVINGGDIGVLQEGNGFARTITATGSTLANPNFTVTLSGTLPPGLKLLKGSDFNKAGSAVNAAQIAGIPTTAGTYLFTLNITDGAGGVGQRQFSVRVSNLALAQTAIAFGTVGQFYSQTFDLRGGTGPYTFSLTTGSLPTGLNFNTATGAITGMPTTTSSVSVGIQVRDSTGDTFIRSYTLNIYSLQITTPNVLPTAIFGRAYSQPLAISPAGVYTWTVTGLPGGLTIDVATGVISGTPTATGTFVATVTAANAATAVVKNFTIFSKTLSSTSMLSGLPTTPLGDVVMGSQVNNVLGVTGGTPPYTVTLASGSLPPGLALVPATQFNPTTNFGRYAIGGVPTTPGAYSFRLQYTDAAGVFAVRTINLPVRTIGLATATPGLAIVNQFYSAQLMGVGAAGPFTFVLAPTGVTNILPPGLNLSATGLLSGTPTSTGAFTFAVDLTAGGVTRRQSVTVTVESTGIQRIDFALGPRIGDLTLGLNLNTLLTPTGGAGTHTWSIVSGTIPPGLQLLTGANLPAGFTAPNALLAGVPSTAGDYTFRIRVDDSTGNFGIRDATVHVTPLRGGPINLPYTQRVSTTPMRVGTAYSFPLSAVNSAPPSMFTDQPLTFMPTSISMASSGLISGPPGESGNFVQAYLTTDANGATILNTGRGFSAYPAAGPIGVSGLNSATLGDATVGTPYSLNLNDMLLPGYGLGPFNWTIDSGALPTNLSVSGNVITGTPTAAGTATFAAIATDFQGTQHLIPALSLKVGTLSMAPPAGSLPNASAGSAYSTAITAAGSAGPFTYRIAFFSDLPAGLSLAPTTGVLSGTPTTQGSFVLWIEAQDTSANVVRQRYTLAVGPPGVPIPAIAAAPTNVSVNYTLGNPAPSPVPINITSTASNFTYTATASGGTWISASPGSGSTPGTVNANFNVTGLAAATYNGAITITASSTSNSPLVVPVTLTVTAAAVCGFALNPASASALAAGGALGFAVNTTAGCNWTATTADSWITVNTPSGTGPGSVSLTVALNPNPAQRTGSVTVQGLTYTVTQFGSTCAFTISPSSLTVGSGATSGPITISASASGCPWTATTPGGSFLSISGAASGTGSGTVTLNIAANPAGTSRSDSATIAGQTLAVNQAGLGCTFGFSGPSSLPSSGGPFVVGVTTLAGCTWTVDPGPSWIQVSSITSSSGSQAFGLGSGSVSFSMDPNSSTATRTAQILIGGQPISPAPISEAGAPCGFSISANNPTQAASGGGGSVTITASSGSCSWIASSNVSWLTLSATSGTGSSTVNFTVAANPGSAARSAVLTVAGQSFTVNQNGLSCSYTLQSPSANIPSGGGPSSVGVIAASGCPWTAISNVSWAHITAGASSSGTANVGYSVDANTTGLQQSGTLTIAGMTFPVTQAPATCTIALGSPGFAAGEFGGSSSFNYTTSVSSCVHSVQSFSSWITVTSNPYAGVDGSVNFTVDANTFSAARSGVIRVADQEFTVTQAPSSCAYTLTAFGASYSRTGGPGALPMNVSPTACGPPAVQVSASSPPGMITLGTVVPSGPPTSTYTQNYTVNLYQTFINYVRTAQVLVQGQIFTVKQNSF